MAVRNDEGPPDLYMAAPKTVYFRRPASCYKLVSTARASIQNIVVREIFVRVMDFDGIIRA